MDMTAIGLIEGLAETLAALSKSYFGAWSDQLQRRKIFIVWGYTLSALSKPLMIVFPKFLWILGMRITDRLGKGIRTAPRDALLSDESEEKNKGKVFGFHKSMDSLGAALGPLLTLILLLLYHWTYEELFLMAFIPGIIAMVFAFLVQEKKRTVVHSHQKAVRLKDLFAYWKRARKDYRIVSVLLIIFYVFNSSDMLLLLKARHHHMTDYQVIVLYIVYNISYALLALPFGIIGDRLGLRNTIAFGLFFFGLVYVGISLFNSWHELLFLFVCYGVYAAAIEGNIKALLSNLSSKGETATAIGLFTSLQGFTFVLSNTIAGWLWDTFNSSMPFMISGIVSFIISVVLILYKPSNASI